MTEDSPDHQRGVQPGRGELISGQEHSLFTSSVTIAAETLAIVTLGTVPSDENWIPTVMSISCTASGIQRIILVDDAYVVFDTNYDIEKTVVFTDTGLRSIAAGSVVYVWFYNYDTAQRTFYYSLHYAIKTV